MRNQRYNLQMEIIGLLENVCEAKDAEGNLIFTYHDIADKLLLLLENKKVVNFADDNKASAEAAAQNAKAAESTLTDEEAKTVETKKGAGDAVQGKTSKR